MTQQQNPQTLLAQKAQALRTAIELVEKEIKPLNGWDTIWADQCSQALHAVEALQTSVHALIQVHKMYPLLVEAKQHLDAIFQSYLVNERIEEACIRLVAFREVSDSMREEALRKRRRVYRYVSEQLLPEVEKLLPPLQTSFPMVVIEEDTVVDADTSALGKILQIGPGQKEARHD